MLFKPKKGQVYKSRDELISKLESGGWDWNGQNTFSGDVEQDISLTSHFKPKKLYWVFGKVDNGKWVVTRTKAYNKL